MDLDQRLIDDMFEEYGPTATQHVAKVVEFFSDMIAMDREHAEPMKRGTRRMAEVVNEMLPQLNKRRRTRVYDHRDLLGVMDPIPPEVQDIFVCLVATLMLNASDGPFQAAAHLNDGIDALVEVWAKELGGEA